MTGPGTDRIVLELEAGEPIHGRLLDSAGVAHVFRGWLDLCEMLERARQYRGAEPHDDVEERNVR